MPMCCLWSVCQSVNCRPSQRDTSADQEDLQQDIQQDLQVRQVDIQQRLSHSSLSRSTSSLLRCPSLSATSSTSASPRVIQPWRASSSRLIQRGHATSSTVACEPLRKSSACHTTRATSTSTCVPVACSGVSWYVHWPHDSVPITIRPRHSTTQSSWHFILRSPNRIQSYRRGYGTATLE